MYANKHQTHLRTAEDVGKKKIEFFKQSVIVQSVWHDNGRIKSLEITQLKDN